MERHSIVPIPDKSRVVVVAPTPAVAALVMRSLPAPYETVFLTDFLSAKAELELHPPDLLVAEVRLGSFNGLHLAIRARAFGARTQTIVIGAPDGVLQSEALRQEAFYLTMPFDESTFSALVLQKLQQARQALPDAPPSTASAYKQPSS